MGVWAWRGDAQDEGGCGVEDWSAASGHVIGDLIVTRGGLDLGRVW